MKLGLLFAMIACFLWGLIFVIPQFLSEFTAMEVIFGRYVTYGGISALLLLSRGWRGIAQFPPKAWMMAFTYALLANVLYYLGLIVALRFATPPVTVLILGMTPIVAALYANWHSRELTFKQLLFPSLSMAGGIILINVATVDWSFKEASLQEYLLGLACVLAALLCWSWYAVSNARFLKMHASIPRGQWATLIGIGSLVWVCALAAVLYFLMPQTLSLKHMASTRFIGGALVLGIVCSWMACSFWNRASSYLPMALMGALIIFETIFGIIFVFIYETRMPSLMEVVGMTMMMAGIGIILARQYRAPLAGLEDQSPFEAQPVPVEAPSINEENSTTSLH